MHYEEIITRMARSVNGIATVVGVDATARKEMLILYSEKLPEKSKLFVISGDRDTFESDSVQVVSQHPSCTPFENLNRAIKAALKFNGTHIIIDSNALEGLEKSERCEIFMTLSEIAEKVNIAISFPDSSFVEYYNLYILDTFKDVNEYGDRWKFASKMLGIVIVDFQQIDVEASSNILAVEFEYKERLALDYNLEIDYLVEVITGFSAK